MTVLKYMRLELFKPYILDANTGALFHFDEGTGSTTYDETTNDNDLTITGATWERGRHNYCLNFDGTNDFLSAADHASLKPASAMTIEFWLLLDTSKAQTPVVKQTPASYLGYKVRITDAEKVEFTLGNGSALTTLTSATALTLNELNHVACVWTGTTMKIYINGVQDANTESFSSISHSTALLYIGTNYGGTGERLDGKIDELRISDNARTSFPAAIGHPFGQIRVKQPNREKIGTAYASLVNIDDILESVDPTYHFGIYVGAAASSRTKVFGGKVKRPNRTNEQLIISAQGYSEVLQRMRLTTTIKDTEASTLIKDTILAGTGIIPDDIDFVGLQTERLDDHIDLYGDENNIDSTTNVNLIGGIWTINYSSVIPASPAGDGWTENSSVLWSDQSAGSTVITLSDNTDFVALQSYSVKLAIVENAGSAIARLNPGGTVDVSSEAIFRFYIKLSKDLTAWGTNYPRVKLVDSGGNYKTYYLRSAQGVERDINATDTDYQCVQVDLSDAADLSSGTYDPSLFDYVDLEFQTDGNDDTFDAYVDNLCFCTYVSGSGPNIISNSIFSPSFATKEYLHQANVDATVVLGSGTGCTNQTSNDNGDTFTSHTLDAWHTLPDNSDDAIYHGRYFKYKWLFQTGPGEHSPQLKDITISFRTKKINVYKYKKFSDESRWDCLRDVLEDSSLEGYTDPENFFVLDFVKDSGAPPGGEVYLREKYEIMAAPQAKQSTHETINKQKVIGSNYGANDGDDIDEHTENDASSWTDTGDVSTSDETDPSKVKEGGASIKGSVATASGFHDDCNDQSIDSAKFGTKTAGAGTLIEVAGGYINVHHISSQYNDLSYFWFKTPTYSISGDYEVEFRMRINCNDLDREYCINACTLYPVAFLSDPPVDGDGYGKMFGYCPYIIWSASWDEFLYAGQGFSQEHLGAAVLNQYYIFKITRVGDVISIWIDGDLKYSGTKGDNNHNNIQFGDCINQGVQPYAYNIIDVDFDWIKWNYVAGGGNTLSPTFNKNLNLFEEFFCWWWQLGYDSIEVRMETSPTAYYSRSVSPKRINDFYEMALPVGSTAPGWDKTGSPSWDNINNVRFVIAASNDISNFWIDKMYYSIGPVEATAEDYTDITDVHEGKAIIDRQLETVAQCQAKANAIVAGRRNILEPIELEVFGREDIVCGDLVKVKWTPDGIDDEYFRVGEVHYEIIPFYVTRLFCQDVAELQLEAYLNRLDRETKQLSG